MQKSAIQIIIESIVVGQLLIYMYLLVKYVILPNILPFTVESTYIILFVTGFLFHIFCEITGINLLYVQNYTNILNTVKRNALIN